MDETRLRLLNAIAATVPPDARWTKHQRDAYLRLWEAATDYLFTVADEPHITVTATTDGTVPALPVPSGPAPRMSCPHCDKTFGTEQGLLVHTRRVHKEIAPQLPAADESPANKPKSSLRECNVCGQFWPGHPQCAECGRLIGPGHEVEERRPYRKFQLICPDCDKKLHPFRPPPIVDRMKT